MKTILLTLALLGTTLASISQNSEYYKAMGESLSQYSKGKSIDDFRASGNRFLQIAQTEKSAWLPYYYHAHSYIVMSFMETDAAQKDAHLDVAEKSLISLFELAPAEPEALILQGLLYSARLVVNPAERGQKYSMLSSRAIGTALEMEPANPRARLMKIQNEMGMARFFGKEIQEYCLQARDLLMDWDSYVPSSPLHPSWGKQQAANVVKECNL